MYHLILFADDTNIFTADHNLNDLISNINSELQAISECFQINKLFLRIDKQILYYLWVQKHHGHHIFM